MKAIEALEIVKEKLGIAYNSNEIKIESDVRVLREYFYCRNYVHTGNGDCGDCTQIAISTNFKKREGI